MENKNNENIKPLYEQYSFHMSQFFQTEDSHSWRDKAYSYLNLYKTAQDRSMHLISKNGKAIGFALVNHHFRFVASGYAIAEFYICREYQKQGYGRKLAGAVFSNYLGQWEVAVAAKNASAHVFWESVISDYTQGRYEVRNNDEYDGSGFVFQSVNGG